MCFPAHSLSTGGFPGIHVSKERTKDNFVHVFNNYICVYQFFSTIRELCKGGRANIENRKSDLFPDSSIFKISSESISWSQDLDLVGAHLKFDVN